MEKIKPKYFIVFEDESIIDVVDSMEAYDSLEEAVADANDIRILNKSYQIIKLSSVYAPKFKHNSRELE